MPSRPATKGEPMTHPTTQPAHRLSPTETAKLIRRTLRREYPQTRFQLVCSRARGTGYGYMTLHWLDGPTTRSVQETVQPFISEVAGEQPDDAVRRLPVPYTCKGIHLARHETRPGS